MADGALKAKIRDVLAAGAFEGVGDLVDVSDGDGADDDIHVVIVSRKLDGRRLKERNDCIWDVLETNLEPEEWGKVSLTIGVSPQQLKALGHDSWSEIARPATIRVPLAACPPVPGIADTGGQAASGTRESTSPDVADLPGDLDCTPQGELRAKVYRVLKEGYFRGPDDAVDVTDGWEGNVHVVVVSHKFDGKYEEEKQDLIRSELVRALPREVWDKVSLMVGVSPEALKSL